MKLLLFVSPNCPHCPKAEHVVREVVPEYSEKGLSYRKVRTKTAEGKALSSKYYVMGTPTILFLDDDWNEIKRIVGTPSESNLRNKIEKLLGLKKSFFSKIFGGKSVNQSESEPQ